MDTTSSSSSTLTASVYRIKRCMCGSRISRTLQFQLLCTNFKVVTCNLETHCYNCQSCSREKITKYLKHKTSLLQNHKSRSRENNTNSRQQTYPMRWNLVLLKCFPAIMQIIQITNQSLRIIKNIRYLVFLSVFSEYIANLANILMIILLKII